MSQLFDFFEWFNNPEIPDTSNSSNDYQIRKRKKEKDKERRSFGGTSDNLRYVT